MSKKKKPSQARTKAKQPAKSKKTSARKVTQSRGNRFQREKINAASFIAAQMNGTQQLDDNTFAALKASVESHVNLKNLLATDANERISNVNRNLLTKNFIKNCKRDAGQAFRVIRKLKGPKGHKKKYRLMFGQAIKSLTGNLSIHRLTDPPYAQDMKEALKECSKCYYGRSMLYSFRPSERAAFRLNANTFLKKMAPYEGEYRNKEKHVNEVASLLFESYMDSAKHFEAKKPKNYLKHIEQQCSKAVTVMLMEAFSLQGQAKIEKWYSQYLKITKMEAVHNIAWTTFNQTGTGQPRTGAGSKAKPPTIKPYISMFRFSQLNNNVLVARSTIKKNRCILSEPILTAKWSNKLSACAQCNKQIKSNWGVPCSSCTQAVFCSNLCARTSAFFNRHSPNKCVNYCFRLKTAATLVHQLAELCGGPNELQSLLALNNGAGRFPSLNESLQQSPLNVNIKAVALLTSGYSDHLNGILLTPELAYLLTDAIHLTEVLKIEFPQSIPANDVTFGKFIFQLLRFASGNPIACAKVGRPGAQERPATTNRPQMRRRRPKSFGFALGMMDSLFSFSCSANVRRQLNLRTGTIEYVAIKDIRQGDWLSINWQARKLEPGKQMSALLHDAAMTKRFMKAQVQDCLFCKTKGQGGTVIQ